MSDMASTHVARPQQLPSQELQEKLTVPTAAPADTAMHEAGERPSKRRNVGSDERQQNEAGPAEMSIDAQVRQAVHSIHVMRHVRDNGPEPPPPPPPPPPSWGRRDRLMHRGFGAVCQSYVCLFSIVSQALRTKWL